MSAVPNPRVGVPRLVRTRIRLGLLVVTGLLLVSVDLWAGDEPPSPASRVYDVGALLESRPEGVTGPLGIFPRGQAAVELIDEATGTGLSNGAVPPVPFLDAATLTELVHTFVTDHEGSASLDGRWLHVEGPPEVQARAGAFLAGLWRLASRRVDVEAELLRVPAEAVAKLDPALLAAVLRGRLDPDEAAALRRAASAPRRGTARVAPGRVAVVGEVERVRYVADYSVEIAQASIVGDPDVEDLDTGWRVEARPLPLLDGRVLLEAHVEAASRDGPMRRLDLGVAPFGTLDMPSCRVLRASCRTVTDGVASRVLALREASGDLVAFLLRATPTPAPAPTTAGSALPFDRLDLLALTSDPRALVFVTVPDDGFAPRLLLRAPDLLAPASADGLASRLEAAAPEAFSDDESGVEALGDAVYVRGSPAARAAARARAQELEGRATGGARVTLRLRARSADGAPTLLAEAGADLADGIPASLVLGRERAYLADWDVEVAQEARVGDPIVKTLFDGLEVGLRATATPIEGTHALSLELRFVTASDALAARPTENECTGDVEVPDAREAFVSDDLVLEAGRPTVRDVGTLADGRRLELEIAVTPEPEAR